MLNKGVIRDRNGNVKAVTKDSNDKKRDKQIKNILEIESKIKQKQKEVNKVQTVNLNFMKKDTISHKIKKNEGGFSQFFKTVSSRLGPGNESNLLRIPSANSIPRSISSKLGMRNLSLKHILKHKPIPEIVKHYFKKRAKYRRKSPRSLSSTYRSRSPCHL